MTPLPGGQFAIMTAALLWSTIGLATSYLPDGTPPASVGAARVLGGGLLLLTLCRAGRLRAVLTRRRPVAVAAVAMASYQACYFSALDLAGVTVGSVVAMTSVPVFAGLLAVVRRRGGVTGRWLLATTLAISGVALLALARPDGRPMTAGVLLALGAGVSYAVFTVGSATVIQRGGDPGVTMAVVFLSAGLLLSPALLLDAPGWLVTPHGAAVIGYLIVVASAGAYLLYGRGLRTTAPATAGTLALLEPACAAVIGVLLLREPMSARSVVGLAVLTAALLLLTLPSGRRRSSVAAPAPDPSESRPPVADPLTVPVSNSLTVPASGPLTVPVSGQIAVPVPGPAAVPVSGPVSVPVSNSLTVPVPEPVTVPDTGPFDGRKPISGSVPGPAARRFLEPGAELVPMGDLCLLGVWGPSSGSAPVLNPDSVGAGPVAVLDPGSFDSIGTGAGPTAVVDPGPFGSRGWIVLDTERSALAWEPLAAVGAGPASTSGRRRP
ncbi:hypothetical protein GCM10010112_21060 [Actinoplanes lobatus]|uniref:Drug/metabolite transporter (DMT)-like permease n=1 Tax=Actinoplanes lobatus TaxID=113568 RepID=A0A7W7HPK9_9ACTN|nr:EamA family transporter [Actinoplanes lobatus]MBB4754361.1 drug/metabolite transporter (DMT)-like permease [Actinoplanes lobatus]GGN62630.1 hypothetical protein GCM10010112_21060 [Actinoplanes lobatus]GIE40560.1 hypothetical protein Alo02nite_34580 [Actinoplanes lobatus]